jgi:hypothetical protein
MSETVTLSYRETIARSDIYVPEATWPLPTIGEAGGLTIELPKSHPACKSRYFGINSLVRWEHPDHGVWRGVMREPVQESPERIVLRYRSIAQWLETGSLPATTWTQCTPGAIAYQAWAFAYNGNQAPLLRFAFPGEMTPILETFTWEQGESPASVYKRLADASGQEWIVRDDILQWGAFGTLYPHHLTIPADADLDASGTDPAEMVARIVARSSAGLEAEWNNPDPAAWDWPISKTISSSATDLVALQAEVDAAGLLVQLAQSTLRIWLREQRLGSSSQLTPAPFSIREGDYLSLSIPTGGAEQDSGLYGTTGLYRVRARRYSASMGGRIGLDLQLVPPTTSANIPLLVSGGQPPTLQPPSGKTSLVRAVADLTTRVESVETSTTSISSFVTVFSPSSGAISTPIYDKGGAVYHVLAPGYYDSTAGTDLTAAINAALTAATASRGVVRLPDGWSWTTTGGHVIPAGVTIEGGGSYATRLTHTGNNVCFTATETGTTNLFAQRQFRGFWLEGNAGASAVGFLIGGFYRPIVDNVFVNGYSAGRAFDFYNGAADTFTEGIHLTNVHVRGTKYPYRFRQAAASGNESFAELRFGGCNISLDVANGIGIDVPDSGTYIYGGHWDIKGNVDATGCTIVNVAAGALVQENTYSLYFEATQAVTRAAIGSGGAFWGHGVFKVGPTNLVSDSGAGGAWFGAEFYESVGSSGQHFVTTGTKAIAADGDVVALYSTASGGGLHGLVELTYYAADSSRQHHILVSVNAWSFDTAPTLAVVDEWAYGGEKSITALAIKQLSADASNPHLIATIGNRNSQGGTLSLRYLGTHGFPVQVQVFPAAAAGTLGSALTTLGRKRLIVTGFSWDPASIADGSFTATAVTVTGVTLAANWVHRVAFDKDLAGTQWTAYTSATNTVVVLPTNLTGGAVDLASGTGTLISELY